jgi:hypothetical protein
VSEGPTPPEFHIDTAAARFIGENGGRVYVWLEAFGGGFETLKTSLDEPALEDTTFLCYQPEQGLEVYVDDAIIPPPDEWWLSYHRFPRRHISADFPRTVGPSAESGGG